TPFTPRLLVVPSSVMQQWLVWKFAQDPLFQIFMGVEVLTLKQATERVSKLLYPHRTTPFFPDTNTLSLALEPEVSNLESVEIPRSLSRELGKLFHEYGIYARHLEGDGWQQQLYKKIYQSHPEWQKPIEWLESLCKEPPAKIPLQLHLFGQSFIPESELRFFKHISRAVSVRLYQLFPSAHFLGDLEAEQEFLTNFGKLPMVMQRQLDALDPETLPCFMPVEGKCSLTSLQKALLNQEPLGKVQKDSAIEIHVADSPLREIEVLYDNVLRWVEQEGIDPADLLVMAPDIGRYSAAIEAIFGLERSPIRAEIYDLSGLSSSALFSALKALFGLAENRFDIFSVLEVLENPLLGKGFGIRKDQIKSIKSWLEKVHVRWGFDENHRKEALKTLYGVEIETGSQGSWKDCFDELCKALYAPEQSSLKISLLETPLLGLFISTLEKLKTALEPILKAKKQTLTDWSEWLWKLWELVAPEGSLEDQLSSDEARLFEIARSLKRLGASVGEVLYEWESVRGYLDAELEKRSLEGVKRPPGALRFCSMLPMRALPAQAVVLLGMEEKYFPKLEPDSPLDLLGKNSEYKPSRSDFDRSLFLEAVLSARKKIVFSASLADEESALSPFVHELLVYLRWKEEDVVIVHPAFCHMEKSYLEKSEVRTIPPLKPFLEAKFTLPEVEKAAQYDIKAAVNDPLKLFVRHTLGIKFPKIHKFNNQDLLAFDNLQKAVFRREAFNSRQAQPLKSQGTLGNIEMLHTEGKKKASENWLASLGVESFFRLEVCEGVEAAIKAEGDCLLVSPPAGSIALSGKVEGIC
ncbi:MAG: exodeoxyribonuclease V subunit gamma, partial [Chlamydiia bacterium]|nr:exodeoxyribonuclease V subunit gamma [Chlamydiia bacterium]